MLTNNTPSVFRIILLGLSFILEGGLAYSRPLLQQSGTIKMAGGTAHISFMQEIGSKLTQLNPELKILISGGGSGVGVQKLGAGLVDLANTGRPLSIEEKKRFGLSSYPLALDAISFIVHPENPVGNLSSSDLQKIFSGEILTWEKWTKSEKHPIHIYVRDEASGTQDIFVEQILKAKKIVRGANFTNSNGAMKLAVANDRYGIGFVSFGYLDDSVKNIRLNGIQANLKNIREKRYPLIRSLYVNSLKNPSLLVKEFLDYVRGPEGAAVITKWALVPTYVIKVRKDGRGIGKL
jgi:phosphate transport system substrate-binding protein